MTLAVKPTDPNASQASKGADSTADSTKKVADAVGASISLSSNSNSIGLTQNSIEVSLKKQESTEDESIDGRKFAVAARRVKLAGNDWKEFKPDTKKDGKFVSFCKYVGAGLKYAGSNTIPVLRNFSRRRWGFDDHSEYVSLESKEQTEGRKIMRELWMQNKEHVDLKINDDTYYTIQDIHKMSLKLQLNSEGKPDLKGRFRFIVEVYEKNEEGKQVFEKDGKTKVIKKITLVTGSASNPDADDDCEDFMEYIGKSFDFPSIMTTRKAMTPQEVKSFTKEGVAPNYVKPTEVDSSSETSKAHKVESPTDSKNNANNCWIHAGVKSILLNSEYRRALKTYFKDREKFDRDFEENCRIKFLILSKEEKSRYSNDVEKYVKSKKADLTRNTFALLECLKRCEEELHKDPTFDVKNIIDVYSSRISAELNIDPGVQGDAVDIQGNLKHTLEQLNLLHPAKLETKLKLEGHADHTLPLDPEPDIELDLSSFSDDSLVNIEDKIKFFFDDPSGSLAPIRIGDQDYRILNEQRRFQTPPESISLHIKRFKQVDDKSQKVSTPLTNIPNSLEYSDGKFQKPAGTTQGDYKFKYAIIHHGVLGSGHYYTIYKDQAGKWFKYSSGNTTEIAPTKDQTIEQIIEAELTQAVYIHYDIN